MTNSSQTSRDQSEYVAISPRPLGNGVASAYISTFDGKHYAHAITHHNFQSAVPSEYGATTFHMADDISCYLSQREHIIEAAVSQWHGGTAAVRTIGPYEYDDVSSQYEFIVEVGKDPTEGNAILALLEVDPGYLADDPDINEYVAHALRAFDQLSIANPEHPQETTQQVFVEHFVGLFQQEAEDWFRDSQQSDHDLDIAFDQATRTYLAEVATDFYCRYEADIVAWQIATEHSVPEFAYLITAGKSSNLPNLRSFDLPNPQSYALDEHVISIRLHRNMVNDLPRLPMATAFTIDQDGRVTVNAVPARTLSEYDTAHQFSSSQST